jgi:8-oxo-dGTP pyrophosphatase MutT (NUDIX family)
VEALRREVLEETGLMVEPASIRGVFGGAAFRYAYPNGDVVEYTVVLFKCIVLNQFARLVGPETKSLGYFSKDELPDLALPYPYDVLFEGV